ncbi:YceI family protein [Aliivibrio fischeri]|uniref:YceI family protein n=1 Tax=Aliivibrio fischeri TaxID=668 RepID=UPI0012D8CBA7|nr:YceI family protein [Aliivibrio fischeri]MUK25700.1 YceI family protein [Aliivibrio fischeri]MUK34335.1 YceI family protein [Aliivibrio fischeri]MUK66318.1 YceI family protein [Aliivibrio fischeri]
MKKIISSLSFALVLISTPSFAADNYLLEPELSSVSFTTIKNQFVVEPATINTLSGELNKSGEFSIDVDLKGISTGIPIRDNRLNELFFESVKYPEVEVSGKVDLSALSNGPKKLVIPAKVTLYGKTKSINFPVVVLEEGNHVMVSSSSAVIIGASDFGIPSENLTKLAATVGGIKISDRVPVSLTLVFKK